VLRDLPLILTTAAFGLHLLGERMAAIVTGRPRSRAARLRALSFYAGLLVVIVALAGPIDSLAEKLFWIHMVQHVLLLTVAPPLIVIGAPWMSIWRPIPLRERRRLARTVARAPWLGWARAAGRWLARPAGALIAFSVNLLAWHIPGAYDLALRSTAVHAVEHMLYLTTGILLWMQVIASPPLRVTLSEVQGLLYLTGAMAVGWVLSLVLAFATTPLYPVYAHEASRPGGISALTDQQLAAGVMLVPGSLTMTLFIVFGLYRWLGQPERADRAGARSARGTARVGSG
jgi:putative membrane protein